MSEILYQGHASLRITTDKGTTIYVDPYLGDGYDRPADLILVTHQHPDHNQIQKPVKNTDCIILENTGMLEDGIYKTANIKDVKVTAVEAYNRSHAKDECVGYILELDGKRIYIAGDTAKTEQMGNLGKIDYAFLPIDPTFTMSPREAEECAAIIDADFVIPYHMKPGALFDKRAAEKFKAKNKLVLEPKQSISI